MEPRLNDHALPSDRYPLTTNYGLLHSLRLKLALGSVKVIENVTTDYGGIS